MMASSVRQKKVAERIKQEVAGILHTELKDPRIGMASVVRVKISSDLRDARVFVSVYGNEKDKEETMHGIRRAKGFIQGLVAGRLQLRFAPVLHFQLDESIERSIRISKILDGLAKEREDREEASPDASPGGQEDGSEDA